jgi:hypothetical protein
MENGADGGPRRTAKIIVSATFMLSLVGCGGFGLLPHETQVLANANFQTYEQVSTAYTDIVPGTTRLADLPRLGFDTATTPNVEVLSYLGVIERFMPRNSMTFDRLAAPVQACIEAQDRCSAFVFHPQHIESQRTGSIFLDVLGFERQTLDTGWQAEVVLLMQDGHVAYKLMSGRPRIEDMHDTVQPLGPLQDIGNTAFRAASRFL